MLEHKIGLVGPDGSALAHFIDVDLSEGVNLDLVAILQIFQVEEDAGGVICLPDVPGDDGIACPRWERRTVEPAGVISQPG